MHEEMASVYNELAQIQLDKGNIEAQIKELSDRLAEMKTREDQLRHQVGLAPTARTHRVKDLESITDIRRAIRSVAMVLGPSLRDPLPKQVLAKTISQKLPNVEVEDIAEQIVVLSKIPDSCVRHNGMRGQGSGYTLVAPQS